MARELSVEIFTKYRRPDKTPFLEGVEKYGEKFHFDRVVPGPGNKDRILDILSAGSRLERARALQYNPEGFRGLYEFGPDEPIPDNYEDVSRRPGFDMADATALKNEIAMRQIQRAKEAKRQKEADRLAADDAARIAAENKEEADEIKQDINDSERSDVR